MGIYQYQLIDVSFWAGNRLVTYLCIDNKLTVKRNEFGP